MSETFLRGTEGYQTFNVDAAAALGLDYGMRAIIYLKQLRCLPQSPLTDVAVAARRWGWTSEGFGEAVAAYQRLEGLMPVDKKLGAATWAHIQRRVKAKLRLGAKPSILVAGIQVPLVSTLVATTDRTNTFQTLRPRHVQVTLIVGHWGGVDIGSCTSALKSRSLSTHFICAPELDSDGRLEVVQVADIAHVAAHVGDLNNVSVGVDIARSPVQAMAKYHGKTAADCLPNTTGRGDATYLPLPAGYEVPFAAFIRELGAILDLDVEKTYPGHGVLSEGRRAAYGFLGHHHLKGTKWDIAPWADVIWGELEKRRTT